MAILGRRVEVALGEAGTVGQALTGFTVSFVVDMSKGTNAHTATIRIHNANPSTLAILETASRPTVQLRAGYGDSLLEGGGVGVPRSLFLGEVIRGGLTIDQQGVDSIATLQAKDTPGAYQLGNVRLSYTRSVRYSTVVLAIISALGLTPGTIRLPNDILLGQGGVFAGAARDILTNFANASGASWWISDGVLNFVGDSDPIDGVAPVFSSVLGNLIGSPAKKDRGLVEARCLLDASMRPGLPYRLESERINGVYIASSVRFEGNSGWDTPFYVVLTGRAA